MNKLLEQLKLSYLYELINPLVQRYELAKWLFNRKNSTPHLVKQKMVRKYASKFDIKTFVETGTYLGVMVNAVKNMFEKIYTIELDKKLYERAKKKFSKNRNVTVLLGNSGEVLPKVLTKLRTPTLFWLDAHCSGGITVKGKVETPILVELSQIIKANKERVILVDDANLFDGTGGYPTLKTIRKIVTKKNKNYKFRVENNVIVIII